MTSMTSETTPNIEQNMNSQFNQSQQQQLDDSFKGLLDSLNQDQSPNQNNISISSNSNTSQNTRKKYQELILDDEVQHQDNSGDVRELVDQTVANQIKNSSAKDKKNFSLQELLGQSSQETQENNIPTQESTIQTTADVPSNSPQFSQSPLFSFGNSGSNSGDSNGSNFENTQTSSTSKMAFQVVPVSGSNANLNQSGPTSKKIFNYFYKTKIKSQVGLFKVILQELL